LKTNVTIRIDEHVAEKAKELDLNISKISQESLLQAIEEETKPYKITDTSEVVLEAELIYNIRQKTLAISFVAINASGENVIQTESTTKS